MEFNISQINKKLEQTNEALLNLTNKVDPGSHLPIPPIISGCETPDLFDEWSIKIKNKIAQSMQDEDPNMQINYIASRTTGRAFSVIKSRLPSTAGTSVPYQNADEALNVLFAYFKRRSERLRDKEAFWRLDFISSPTLVDISQIPQRNDGSG